MRSLAQAALHSHSPLSLAIAGRVRLEFLQKRALELRDLASIKWISRSSSPTPPIGWKRHFHYSRRSNPHYDVKSAKTSSITPLLLPAATRSARYVSAVASAQKASARRVEALIRSLNYVEIGQCRNSSTRLNWHDLVYSILRGGKMCALLGERTK